MIDFKHLEENTNLTSLFTRDDKHIKACLKEIGTGEILATQPLQIHFPEKYMQTQELFRMNTYINMLGIFAIVDPNAKKYALFSIPARVFMPATAFRRYDYQESSYRYIQLEKGDVFIMNNQLIIDDKIEYYIYNYYIANGYVPWYMNYLDVLKLFDQSYHYIKRNLAANSQIIEMVFSNIARLPANQELIYRGGLKDYSQITKQPPQWIGLRNISVGALDTFSKVMGAYYKEGLNSALVEKSRKLTEIEKVMRA